MSDLLKSAFWYLDHGYSIIPVKKDKRPYIPWEKYQKEYATKEDVEGWFKKYPDAMIGMVTGKLSGVSVIDIDTKEGFDAMGEILPDSLSTPTVTTPKLGQHLWFKTPEKILGNNARAIPGCDFRGEGGYVCIPPSENGNGKRYEFLDGLKIGQVALATLPDAYINAVKSFNNNINTKECLQAVDSMFVEGRRDNDIFHVAHMLCRGNMPRQEISQVLERLIVSCYGKPDKQMAKDKLESALKRKNNRAITLSDEVTEFVLSTTGVFLSTEVINCLQLSTRDEKKNLSIILKRLKDKEIIEKYGNKNGTWRVVDNECEDIDFLNAPASEIDIAWPFGIETWVKTLPKNIIIVAGEGNAGKTAFLLNLVEMNMHKHDIQYFSSEMGSVEMRERLSKFNRPLDSWKFKPKERMSNFGDVIKPDSINIIDFLEVYDDFYRIGAMIREMYDSLDKGIAVIAIQKNKGADYGLGGARSLEKARLYLNIEAGKVTIVKGKNWRKGDCNPNGMTKDFKLVQGCEFKDSGYWVEQIRE